MNVQMIVTPSGEELVILSRADYDELMDGRLHAEALAAIAAGRTDKLTEAQLDAYLAAPTPLAFWRAHRGMTQRALADALGISQAYLSQIESGKRTGDIKLYAKIGRALSVQLEDLVEEDDAAA